MKLITEPSVYLVGRQELDSSGMKGFLDAHGIDWQSDAPSDGEYLAETAGRVCYMSYSKPRPGGNKAYLDNILDVGHGSVIEHVVFNFIITGISRSLSHELVRHRIGTGFSQLSQRYVDESVAEYVVPDAMKEEVLDAVEWIKTTLDRDITLEDLAVARAYSRGENRGWRAALDWLYAIAFAHETYKSLANYLNDKLEYTCSQCGKSVTLDSLPPMCASCGGKALQGTERRKAARQAARSVLPNATETKIFFTVNARALRHIIEMRASRHADAEIRKLACLLYEIAVKECPNLFGDYQKVSLPDGTYELATPNRKV